LSLNFSKHILWDYVYQQTPTGEYEFDSSTGDFTLRDKNEFISTILGILKQIYSNIILHNQVKLKEPDCNVILLDQALMKYSRDIYGETRLKARIEHITQLTSTANANLLKFTDYGFKVDSISPYVHREIAVLLYWLSVLKPFSVQPSPDMLDKMSLAARFHNEFISYLLAQAALQIYNLKLTVHKNENNFFDFLYDLHYRNISRSSLEFCLDNYIEDI